MAPGTINLNIYEYSRGFQDSVAGENADSGYHMDIQNTALVNRVNSNQILEGDLLLRKEEHSGTYQDISDFSRVSTYDNDHVRVQSGMTDEYPRAGSLNTAKYEEKVYNKEDSSCDSSFFEETSKANIMYGKSRRPISIVKAADETVVIDNDIYESSQGGMCGEDDLRGELWWTWSCNTHNAYEMKNDVFPWTRYFWSKEIKY